MSAPAAVDPVLRELPASIDTGRMVLRPPRVGDGAAHYEALAESIDTLRRFLASLPWVAQAPSPQASELYCRKSQANFIARTDLPFFGFCKATGRLLLSCGLHRPDWSVPKLEVGYWCRVSETGRGYVSEAVNALTGFAFEVLAAARVELVTDAQNLGSRKVAERCGFALEGVLRQHSRARDGSLRDTCIYARLPAK